MSGTKRMAKVMLVAALIIAALSAGEAMAGSLWDDNSQGASLFADRKAHAVGDIVTIIISENSSAVKSGQADNSKSTKGDLGAGSGIFKFLGGASLSQSDSFKAQGSIANSNSVRAQMTAKVVEVKPNGLLAISGTQSIKQNGEDQKIVLSGLVREDDISANNTVLSSKVAEAQIRIDGSGPIAGKQRQGILTQMFNFLF